MILSSDYHTHTVFSHGKGTVLENSVVAKEKGLKQVGITDHGFSHPAFGLRKRKLPQLLELCRQASKQTGVQVLCGIESNIISESGKTDLSPDRYDSFDLFLAGMHKCILFKPKSIFSLGIPNLVYSTFKAEKVPNSLIKANTKAFINVIKNNPVDVITHLNYCCYSNAVEIAKVASDYGTYLELSSKKVHLTDEEILKILDTGVKFVINSDAHTPDRVGEISLAEKLVKRLNIPLDRICNINGKTPEFRFKSFKEKNL